jgi:hypothetical protein
MSAVSIFSRIIKGALTLSWRCGLLMTLTLLIFLFSGMLYGVVAIGHATELSVVPAVFLLFGSASVSLSLEIAVIT